MGFSLNNFGDALMKIGQSTLQTGTFYLAAKTLNSPCSGGSIWSCGSFGTMGCGMGYPAMGGYGYGMGGMMGMMGGYSTQMAVGQAYGQGYALGEMLKAQGGNGLFMMPGYQNPLLTQTQGEPQRLDPTNNEAAEKFTSHPTELGEQFEEHSKAGKATQFVMSDWEGKAEGDEKKQEYTQYVSNFAKSYIAHIDEKSGNKDNEITEEEFANYNIASDLGADATDADKTEYKALSKIAFGKIDQNCDGKIDWKEMAATLSTYDAMSGSRDGKITAQEVTEGGSSLMDGTSTTMDMILRTEYTRLFGNTPATDGADSADGADGAEREQEEE